MPKSKSKDISNKSLKDTLKDINLHFLEKESGGGSTVMRMGDQEKLDIPSISTGSLGLDIALGIGGIPKGRVGAEEKAVCGSCNLSNT